MSPSTHLRLARPHFLFGGVLMYAVGAFGGGIGDPTSYVLGQLAVSASQLTAHYVNEYADADADALVVNRTWFSGGSGVLVDHPELRAAALKASLVTTTLALGFSALLAVDRPAAASIAAGTIVISWVYSMPPARLLSTGWGEPVTSLVVAVAVPLVGALSQGSEVPTALWWIVVPLFLVHMSMMLGFELPDLDTDGTVGKRVLAVRLGRKVTIRAMAASLLLAFSIVGLAALTVRPGLTWMLLGAPAASMAIVGASNDRFSLLTASAVACLVLSGTGALVYLLT